MNAAVKSVSAAHVSRVLKDAGIWKSESASGRVSDVQTEGFQVIKDRDAVVVRYVSSSIGMQSETSAANFATRRLIALTEIQIALFAKDYEVFYVEGRGWIVEKAVA